MKYLCILIFVYFLTKTNKDNLSSITRTQKHTKRAPTLMLSGRKKITFIHIGKTAGISLQNIFSKSDTLFSECHMLLTKDSCSPGPNIVISVRDPVDRFISAYNYKHPKNCNNGQNSPRNCQRTQRCYEQIFKDGKCLTVSENTRKKMLIQEIILERRFYECFPTIHDIFNVSDKCQVVWDVVFQKGTQSLSHITRGYEFHLKNMIGWREHYYIVRQEHFTKDLLSLGKKLKTSFTEVKKNQHYKTFYSVLTDEERVKIREFPQIKREIEWYNWLIEHKS